MPHVQTESKGKNKKKKSKSKQPGKEAACSEPKAPSVLESCGIKLPANNNENTFINEVEVTMAKKTQPLSKKEKKKLAEVNSNDCKQTAVAQEAIVSADDDKSDLLNLTVEGDIKLKNLPEITVTRTALVNSVPEPKLSEEPADKNAEEKNCTETSASKKKKKKKKKKTSEGKEIKEEVHENNANAGIEAASSEPTYVKLEDASGSCVLLVSHESFSGNNNNSSNNSSAQGAENTAGVNSSNMQPPQSVNLQTLKNSTPAIKEDEKENCPFVSITPLAGEGDPVNEQKGKNEKKNNKKTSADKEKSKAEKQAPQSGQKGNKKATDNKETTQPAVSDVKGRSAKGKDAVKDKKSSQVRTFAHLPPYKPLSLVYKHLESKSGVHPAIVTVTAQCAEGIVSGSNARCVAVLAALKEMIQDYQTPPNKELSRDLESQIQECVNFIAKCCPLSVSTLNAVKAIRHQVNSIPSNTSDDEAKNILTDHINRFVEKEICLAKTKIVSYVKDVIADGDVVMTYAYSSVVKDAICEAHEQKKFRVIVVDSKSKVDGWKMLQCLLEKDIECSYILINGITCVMSDVTKVIVGAHVLQANGSILSHVGSSQIALVASHYNVPFLVCCETYKLSEKVYTDSFSFNELGDPDVLVRRNDLSSEALDSWKSIEKLYLLNILYDVTASHLVSMVITEKGTLPCRV